ncbi:MAG: SPOR domain-containing protein [Bacteroidales bacterium]|nr:SPOR domain-containing protein [Bacteroidales bacterium]
MIDIAAHIGKLVREHELVIIPGLGGFLTNFHSSVIHDFSNRIESPGRHIAFNARLKENDGLLANYFAQQGDIAYKEALQLVEVFAEFCKNELEIGNTISFENLGLLKLSQTGFIEFSPDLSHNYDDDYFGLPDILVSPIEREVVHTPVVQLHPKAKEKFRSTALVLRRVAAIAIPFFVLGFLVFLTKDKISDGFQQVASFVQFSTEGENFEVKDAEKTIDIVLENKPISVDLSDLDLVSDNSEIVVSDIPESTQGAFHLICGAFSNKELANRLTEQLKSEGFESYIAGQNQSGLYRVSSSNFLNKEEAMDQLQWFKINKNKSAWLLTEEL